MPCRNQDIMLAHAPGNAFVEPGQDANRCQGAGVPLKTLDILLESIRDTHTQTGLRVCAKTNGKPYAKGIKVSNAPMRTIRLQRHEVCPDWNYTIDPNTS